MAAPVGLASQPVAGDNRLFVRLRWVLFLWILTDVSVHYDIEPWRFWGGMGLAGAFALSQLVLWRLPAHWVKGLRLYTTVFLLDLFFTIATLFLVGQAEPRLLVVMFLTLFITALVQKLSLSLAVSVMVMAVYAALRLEGHGEFSWQDTRQLLDLPFLLITSVHAAVIVSEAGFHEGIRESLEEDNDALAKKLGHTSRELKDRVRFVMGAFDAVPAAVIVLDPEGVVRAFNQHAEKLFGAARASVLDRRLSAIPFLDLLKRELRRRDGQEAYAGAWLKAQKGGHFYALVRNGIARDADGALLNMAVFVTPTDPPAGTPSFEDWQRQQRSAAEDVLEDGSVKPDTIG
jgi:PAS domain S-box-containing protein